MDTTERFRQIYDAEIRYVWNSLVRLGVPSCDIEDLAQETLLNVYKKLGDYDSARPLRPWLFGFAFRIASDYRKRAYRKHEVSDDAHEQAAVHGGPSVDQEMAREEDRALVAEALRSLSIDKSAVFVMMDIDGHSAPEVADALGIPLNTAYSRLRVAREEFVAAARRLQSRRGGHG